MSPSPPAPLQGHARGLAAFALAAGTFVQVLDTTVANVSVPTIAGNLGVSPDQGTWIITAYSAANGICVPLTGWLMQRYGIVRTFVASMLLFTLASFLCGVAWSLSSLIAFRAVQGFVSGPMIPGSQALLISIFPPEKRGTALGIWAVTALVAPICGPILGGYIADNHPWPWIFFLNLPVGLISAGVCWHFLRDRESPVQRIPVDMIGFLLLVVWVASLQIVLDRGKGLDWFESGQIIVMSLVAAIGCAAFLIWEITEKHPIVNLSVFRSWNFSVGTLILCVGFAIFFGNVILLPLWLQTQVGYTASWAGLVAAPSGLLAVVVAPLIGRQLEKRDARIFASLAFLAFATSYFQRSQYVPDGSFASFAYPLIIQGVALGGFFLSVTAISLHGLKPDAVPTATGVSNFLRIIAGSFAASLTTTLWDRREALHQTRLVETVGVTDGIFPSVVGALNAQGFTPEQGALVIERALQQQSYFLSSLDIFWVSAWISLGLMALVWSARNTVGGSTGVGR